MPVPLSMLKYGQPACWFSKTKNLSRKASLEKWRGISLKRTEHVQENWVF